MRTTLSPSQISRPHRVYSVLVLLLALLASSEGAPAATFVVNSTGDVVDAAPGNGACDTGDGTTCTLRAAIQEANALAGADTINFLNPGQVYALGLNGYDNTAAAGDLDVLADLTINGDGGFVDGVLLTSPDNVFDLRNGATVTINDLTVQNGNYGLYLNDGTTLLLTGVTVQLNNNAGVLVNANFGGSCFLEAAATTVTQNGTYGIQGTGPVTINVHSSSTISSNDCGICIDGNNGGPNLTITDSLIQNNTGTYAAGGISLTTSFWSTSLVSITDSQIIGNSTSNSAGVGGLSVKPASGGLEPTVIVTGATFQGNSGPTVGGLYAFGTVTINGSHFQSNTATGGFTPTPGAVALSVGIVGGPQANISTSTFLSNTGGNGALISQQPLELTNSTFSANAATQLNNGAVGCRTASATCDFEHITVTGTTGSGGYGIVAHSPATIALSNSISANNATFDCAGSIASGGHNLIENVGCGLSGDLTGNQHLVDPELQPLADNGGSTQTHALAATSPAVDGGPLASLGSSQNGVARPADGDGSGTAQVDIGAFELPEPSFDFGDAPDPVGSTGGEYPTLLANNGARHQIVGGLSLGAAVDDETDGQPSADALGDDQSGSDDEDGVTLGSLLVPGALADITVTASAAGFLHAWVDFDQDGTWDSGDEEVFTNQALAAGANSLSFTVPSDAVAGQTYARFRFDSGGVATTPAGAAPDGEVEDYRFAVEPVADLAILKSGPSSATPGSTIHYTVVASNSSGPATALGAQVSDSFPGELFGCTWTCGGTGGGVCSNASGSSDIDESVDLPAGGAVTFLVACSIDPAELGSVTNTATIAAPLGIVDPNGTNDSSQSTASLSPLADLVIQKTDGLAVIEPPDTLTYTIVAENLGPSDVLNAQIEDLFPTQVADVDWTCTEDAGAVCGTVSGMGDISIAADLPVGGSVTISATGTVDDPTPVVITNTATVSSATDDPNASNDSDSDSTEVVTATTVVFIDSFESGDLQGWTIGGG